MQYASDYYGKLKLAKTRSNMNRLCWELEHWQRSIRWKRTDSNFDWDLMVDKDVEVGEQTYTDLEKLYADFNKEMRLTSVRLCCEADEVYRKNIYGELYDRYRSKVQSICCGDFKVAANALVAIARAHKTWNQKFPWVVAGVGIVQNIKQVDASMPKRDPDGQHSYLGRRYSISNVSKEELQI